MWIPSVAFGQGTKLTPVNDWGFSVVLTDMFAIGDYFKIFNSIISLYTIFVMYCFKWHKLATNVILHDISMFKYSLSVYIYSNVASFCNRRFIPYRSIKAFFGMPSAPMKIAQGLRSLIPNGSLAVINITNHTK